jgi:hypothetical protein
MTETIANAALAYVKRGWKPIPVSRRTKKPIGQGWQKRPFDPNQFNGDPLNVGVQFGAVSAGLTDVDLDSTDANALALEFLPPTKAVFGRRSKPRSHRLYVTDLAHTETRSVLQYKDTAGAMIVELRIGSNGKGAMSVFPPSLHGSGETVQWISDGEPARVDGDMLKRSVLHLAVACVLKPAYPGEGSRHEGALVLGGVLASADWNADNIERLVDVLARACRDDDPRDRVVAATSALEAKANSHHVAGLRRLAEVWGQEVAKVLAKWLNIRAASGVSEEILAELNRDNAVVLDGARTRVLRFEEVPHEAGGERYVYRLSTFLPFQDFRNFYLNRYIDVGDTKPMSIGKWWLAHSEHRQYRGVVFVPAGEPVIDGRLNLWRGFDVEAKRGEWPLFREHIYEVLAARDDNVDAYIFRWLAWTVQHPAEQAEVALVFLGGIGTGKGTLGKAMCRIFGQHARHLSSPEHLTGRFNAHLRQCCFLFGDECYGPKDKSAEGTLKRLITEPTLQIEPKGRDVVEEPNRLKVMLASNNEWVIPAGAHERRFAAQEVADTHRQNPNWFGPIYQELRSGGLEAMLFDLLHCDLGDWHPRQIVRTAALAKQQEESLSPLDQWWFELLQTGVLEGVNELAPDRAISNHYEEKITEPDGYGGRHPRTVRREGLYDQARRISPRLKGVSDTALGLYLGDEQRGCTNAWVQGGGRGRRGWQFPPLNECRERWKKRFPQTVWRDQEIKDWTFDGD